MMRTHSLSTSLPVVWPRPRSRTGAQMAAWATALTLSAALLFLLTAGVLVALPLVWLTRGNPEHPISGLVCIAAATLSGALGLYFLLGNDWSAVAGPIGTLGRLITTYRPHVTLPEEVNSNVMASGLLILILLGIGGLAWGLHRPHWLARSLAILACSPPLLLALATLILTASRGAWLGLIAGLLTFVYALWRSGPGRRTPLRYAADSLALTAAGLLLLALTLVWLWPQQAGTLLTTVAGPAAAGRAALWQDAAVLISDYRFTGSGLNSTMMVYSSYVLLLHVGYTSHMHNLLLQVAVEQGVPGLLAYLCMLTGSMTLLALALAEASPARRAVAAATLAALAALLVHGLFDAGLYASRMAPLVGLPLALAWTLRPRRSPDAEEDIPWFAPSLAGAVTPLGLLLLLFLWPGARAAFHANLGAVAQTVAELKLYSWPQWPIQDALRINPAVNLAPAESRYAIALLVDSTQPTAHRRLGQIALARMDLAAARQHLEAAYARAPQERPTRQMLGELYALLGDTQAAVALWQTLDLSAGQLEARQYWVAEQATPEQTALFAAAIAAWSAQP